MACAGKQAVDVFFVLSGFVIAYICNTREPTLRTYVISRTVRIYSVALPALILTFLIDGLGKMVRPEVYDGAIQELSLGLLLYWFSVKWRNRGGELR